MPQTAPDRLSSARPRRRGCAADTLTSKGWEARMDTGSSPTERLRAGSERSSRLPHRGIKLDDPSAEAVIAAHATVIAGGGPAGLTAAYELSKAGHSCVV